ncbi:hypothetical protein P280DRAFT_464581 [Massarina eburnea CBS 473.64]|uniref:Uncharacterized protein n=1 Tax=Massarina eburnea CBS 473.64 TaxID=1395130 RepID=A0A6A6SIV0_9PLEO|nr:hypothetical protein P280DRAFT_464581 [Massarina eburnea CBS 473.64]
MPSHHSSQHQHFRLPPPIRTATSGSQTSQSSGTASPDMLSPTSTLSRSSRSPTFPTEESFFGAITSRIRGRQVSRSREAVRKRGRPDSHLPNIKPAGEDSRSLEIVRKRSKSPLIMPPEHFPPTSSTASPTGPTYTSSHPRQSRHAQTPSQGSVASTSSKATRPSLQGPSRRSTGSSDMWCGRHSNSWLFNDFSVTEQAKDLVRRRRK